MKSVVKQKTFRWNCIQNVLGMEQARSRWIICYRCSWCRGMIFSFMYCVGGLSGLTWCKFVSKWSALLEKAMISSCRVPTYGTLQLLQTFFSLACFAPGHHQCITGPSMYYMAAAPAALLVGVVVDSRTARGARAGSRGARAWRCAATASNPVLQLEVTSCFVVC